VKALFKKFESASDEEEKEEIADQVDLELRVHSMIEEEILYPAMKDIDSEIVAESFEEHGVVEQLLDELATMDLSSDQFEAKFKVMQENVEHHIEEEEGTMFPKAKKLPDYEALGMRLIERKLQLMDELSMNDSSDRIEGGDPATMKASEKSESLLEGAGSQAGQSSRGGAGAKSGDSMAEDKKSETKAPSRSQSRAKSAASGRRSRRSTATAGRSRK
jgi:hemerythrin superfamily protein